MRPEDTTQSLSPLGLHLALHATKGPDWKLSKALPKAPQGDSPMGL